LGWRVFCSLFFVRSVREPRRRGDYPSRPVTLVVRLRRAAGVDQMARLIAGKL